MNLIIINNHSIEPLLCLGYKDGQDGESVSLTFLKRNIDFKLWIRPNEKVDVDYISNTIKLNVNLNAQIKTRKYPHIYLANKKVSLKTSLEFQVELTSKGLTLFFRDLKVQSITGVAYVKWSRFIPKVRLPLRIIVLKLQKELSESLKNQFDNFLLLERDQNINSIYKAQLNSFSNESSFNIGFEINKR
jgi:hypothetical protein